MLVSAVMLSLGACSGGSPLDKLTTLKDEVCKCKDIACVDKLKKGSEDLADVMSKLNEADQEKALDISMAMVECMGKFDAPGAAE